MTESEIPNACIDLKARFGDRYRIGADESYHAERPEFRHEDRHWLTMILCRHGEIFPWGGSELAACTAKSGAVAKRLKSLPSVTVAQDGTDGATVVFDIEDFDQVAEIMRPRKCRRLNRLARKKLVEAGCMTRFFHGAHDDLEARPCVPMGLADV